MSIAKENNNILPELDEEDPLPEMEQGESMGMPELEIEDVDPIDISKTEYPIDSFGTEETNFKQYMKEAKRHPLLSADEEKFLSRRIAKGDKKAFKKMTEKNLLLVIKIARPYMGKGLSLPDLVQEGNMGLMKAIEKFDPERGFRFSTYATWWIRAEVERALVNLGHTIRISTHMVERMNHFTKNRNLLERDGSIVSSKKLEEKIGEKSGTEACMNALRLLHQTPSINHPLSDDPNSEELLDMIEDISILNPEQKAQHDCTQKALGELFNDISEKNRNIIRLRYGLKNVDYHTLQEIADIYNITDESIRKAIKKTLEKVRSKTKELGYLFEDLDVA